jgi:hypothetical protein
MQIYSHFHNLGIPEDYTGDKYKRMSSAPAPAFVTMHYRKVVGLGLTAQAINFAQSEFMGHRVRFSVPVDYMNQYFTWAREANEVRPTGRFTNDPAGSPIANMPTFTELLEWRLGSEYSDIDGVADGLNYASAALDTYNDSKRDTDIDNYVTADAAGATTTTHYGANDLVMAYVLFKCFGSSSFDAAEIVYNLEDAFGMLTSNQLAAAVSASLAAEDNLAELVLATTAQTGNRGKVDDMLRALLAADPKRFFLNGTQIPGLFETNLDASGSGNWCLKAGDIIEVPIKLFFKAPVTVLSVVDNAKQPSSLTPENPETVMIEGEASSQTDLSGVKRENIMSIRLQLQCSAPASGALTYASNEVIVDSVPVMQTLKVVTQMNVTFYNGPHYAETQSAIAVIATGGSGLVYSSEDLPVGLAIDASSGVITFSRVEGTAPATTAVEGIVNGRHAVTITITSDDENAMEVSATIFVAIDDGSGASNTPAV